MIKALIFDVDGVLLDSEKIHYQVEAETLRKFDISVTPEMAAEYSGTRLDIEFPEIAKRFNKTIDFKETLKVRDEILKKAIKKGFPKVPYVVQVLKYLSRKYLLAFATMGEKSLVGEEIKRAGLQKYFKASLFGEEVKNPKPDPEIFLKIASLLKLSPSECIVVEDSQTGLLAGKAAGMRVIIRRGSHNKDKEFPRADFIIDDLRDISSILEGI